MAREVIWADAAQEDLEAAAVYIYRDSPFYAAAFVKRTLTVARSLANFPLRGSRVRELGATDIREIIRVPEIPYGHGPRSGLGFGKTQTEVSLTVSRERRIVLENHYEIGNSYDERPHVRPHVPIGEDQRKSFSMNAEISLTFFNCMSLVRKTFASTSMLAAIWIASMDLRKSY